MNKIKYSKLRLNAFHPFISTSSYLQQFIEKKKKKTHTHTHKMSVPVRSILSPRDFLILTAGNCTFDNFLS